MCKGAVYSRHIHHTALTYQWQQHQTTKNFNMQDQDRLRQERGSVEIFKSWRINVAQRGAELLPYQLIWNQWGAQRVVLPPSAFAFPAALPSPSSSSPSADWIFGTQNLWWGWAGSSFLSLYSCFLLTTMTLFLTLHNEKEVSCNSRISNCSRALCSLSAHPGWVI